MIDYILLGIMIDLEVKEGASKSEIRQLVKAKYPYLIEDEINESIFQAKKFLIKKKLAYYHFLDLDCWEYDVKVRYSYYHYGDNLVWKIMIDESIEKLEKVKPKLAQVLVMKFINELSWSEIMKKINCKSCKTVYNRIDKGIEEIVKIIEYGCENKEVA